jgi:transcriptional regulator with XRE-family HTH domain
MELREYIAKRRKALGISQGEMASALGYTDTAVSKIESGSSNPPISILPSLANELRITLDDLLLMKENPAPFQTPNPPYDSEKVALNIRAIRLSEHLRQKEASERIGVNKRTLVTYEKGDACPNFAVMEELLSLCSAKPSEFFYGTLYPEIQSSPSFKKRGPSPFFVFLLGFLIGGGLLAGILSPLAFRSNGSSSSGPFTINSTSNSTSSGDSSTAASSLAPEAALARDLTVITTDGFGKDAWIKIPNAGETSTLGLTFFTGSEFTSAMRENAVFQMFLDVIPETGTVTLTQGAGKYSWILSIDSKVTLTSFVTVGIKAYWYGSSIPIVGKPLDVHVNNTGLF